MRSPSFTAFLNIGYDYVLISDLDRLIKAREAGRRALIVTDQNLSENRLVKIAQDSGVEVVPAMEVL